MLLSPLLLCYRCIICKTHGLKWWFIIFIVIFTWVYNVFSHLSLVTPSQACYPGSNFSCWCQCPVAASDLQHLLRNSGLCIQKWKSCKHAVICQNRVPYNMFAGFWFIHTSLYSLQYGSNGKPYNLVPSQIVYKSITWFQIMLHCNPDLKFKRVSSASWA